MLPAFFFADPFSADRAIDGMADFGGKEGAMGMDSGYEVRPSGPPMQKD